MKTRLAVSTTALALSAALVAAPATAQVVTHTANDLVASGVSPSPAFGPLVEAVGTQAISYGVDYSYGNAEGIFNDGPWSLCGINGAGNCDLLTAVDGRIVTLGTTNQGLTSSLDIVAGFSAPGALTLSVFGISGNLLETVTGSGDLGPFTITRATADIAYFSIGGPDTFGVRSVSLNTPVLAAGNGVPEPATWALMILGFGAVGGAMRRRQSVTAKVRFA